MAYAVVLTSVPTSITAGNSVSWKVGYSDFAANAGWTLSYTLVKTSVRIQITSTADGVDHLVEIAAATTAEYTVGTYDWQAYVTKGSERYQVDQGVIEIVANFATQSSGLDARSHNKIVLDALEAAIEGRASLTQLRQKVGEVDVEHMTLAEQVKMRDIYAAKYQRELVMAGKAKSHHIIKARFT